MSLVARAISVEQLANRTQYVDRAIVAVGYGWLSALYIMCIPHFFSKNIDGMKSRWFTFLFTTTLFALGTSFFAVNLWMGVEAFVDHSAFEGGAQAFIASIYSDRVVVFGNSALVMQDWLSDSLMLYRCFVIYGGNYLVIAVPILIQLASFGMGTFLLITLASPASTFWTQNSRAIAVPFYSLTMGLNILLTLLIVTRLQLLRMRVKETLGSSHSKQYLSISAMLIESASLSSMCSLAFLIPYAKKSYVATLFQGLTGEIQAIASILIILRVLKGRAWSKSVATYTSAPTSTLPPLQFRSARRYQNENDYSLESSADIPLGFVKGGEGGQTLSIRSEFGTDQILSKDPGEIGRKAF